MPRPATRSWLLDHGREDDDVQRLQPEIGDEARAGLYFPVVLPIFLELVEQADHPGHDLGFGLLIAVSRRLNCLGADTLAFQLLSHLRIGHGLAGQMLTFCVSRRHTTAGTTGAQIVWGNRTGGDTARHLTGRISFWMGRVLSSRSL